MSTIMNFAAINGRLRNKIAPDKTKMEGDSVDGEEELKEGERE